MLSVRVVQRGPDQNRGLLGNRREGHFVREIVVSAGGLEPPT
jgi:hypothetical protein